jgi:hypothetical protein
MSNSFNIFSQNSWTMKIISRRANSSAGISARQ